MTLEDLDFSRSAAMRAPNIAKIRRLLVSGRVFPCGLAGSANLGYYHSNLHGSCRGFHSNLHRKAYIHAKAETFESILEPDGTLAFEKMGVFHDSDFIMIHAQLLGIDGFSFVPVLQKLEKARTTITAAYEEAFKRYEIFRLHGKLFELDASGIVHSMPQIMVEDKEHHVPHSQHIDVDSILAEGHQNDQLQLDSETQNAGATDLMQIQSTTLVDPDDLLSALGKDEIEVDSNDDEHVHDDVFNKYFGSKHMLRRQLVALFIVLTGSATDVAVKRDILVRVMRTLSLSTEIPTEEELDFYLALVDVIDDGQHVARMHFAATAKEHEDSLEGNLGLHLFVLTKSGFSVPFDTTRLGFPSAQEPLVPEPAIEPAPAQQQVGKGQAKPTAAQKDQAKVATAQAQQKKSSHVVPKPTVVVEPPKTKPVVKKKPIPRKPKIFLAEGFAYDDWGITPRVMVPEVEPPKPKPGDPPPDPNAGLVLVQTTSDIRELYTAALSVISPLFRFARRLGQAGGASRVYWNIKPLFRSIVKSMHAYNGETNRLLDIARCAVVFPHIRGIQAALNRLRQSRNITVVRLKQRFLRPAESGYRDILVNVVIDGHICEIQLHLDAMWRVMRETGRRAHKWIEKIPCAKQLYHGELNGSSLRHGWGKNVCGNGCVYYGEWRNNRMHGTGVYMWPTGDIYRGSFVDHKIHGRGVCHYADGCVYSGEWNNGIKHGYGTYHLFDGSWYEGPWRNGGRNGIGTFVWGSGDVYKGPFVDGKFCGVGTKVNRDGSWYQGDWVDNKMEGKGKYVWANNTCTYEGRWKDNKMHGFGTMYYANGTIYRGSWVNGMREGAGKLIGDRVVFEGEFRRDLMHGHGTWHCEPDATQSDLSTVSQMNPTPQDRSISLATEYDAPDLNKARTSLAPTFDAVAEDAPVDAATDPKAQTTTTLHGEHPRAIIKQVVYRHGILVGSKDYHPEDHIDPEELRSGPPQLRVVRALEVLGENFNPPLKAHKLKIAFAQQPTGEMVMNMDDRVFVDRDSNLRWSCHNIAPGFATRFRTLKLRVLDIEITPVGVGSTTLTVHGRYLQRDQNGRLVLPLNSPHKCKYNFVDTNTKGWRKHWRADWRPKFSNVWKNIDDYVSSLKKTEQSS